VRGVALLLSALLSAGDLHTPYGSGVIGYALTSAECGYKGVACVANAVLLPLRRKARPLPDFLL